MGLSLSLINHHKMHSLEQSRRMSKTISLSPEYNFHIAANLESYRESLDQESSTSISTSAVAYPKRKPTS